MTVEHRVAAAVLVREARVLMCHRRADRPWYPDVWDFPGGHLEDGETAADAVRRECREELGVEVEGQALELTLPDPRYPELLRRVLVTPGV